MQAELNRLSQRDTPSIADRSAIRPGESDVARGLRPSKTRQILAAARDLFMQTGFEASSMESVARHAQVSKATLYAHFPGKQVLFTAVVAMQIAQFSEEVRGIADGERQDCRGVLVAIGRRYLTLLLSPQARQLFRIVIAESPHVPGLGAAMLETTRSRIYGTVGSALLQHEMVDEVSAEVEKLVSQFLALLRGDLHLQLLVDPSYHPQEQAIEQHVGEAVDLFIAALRNRA